MSVSYVKIFNQVVDEFFNELIEIFPEEKELQMAKFGYVLIPTEWDFKTVDARAVSDSFAMTNSKNMTKYFEENGFKEATDHNINKYLISKDIFYSSNTILVTGNPRLGSDIFTL